MIAVGLQPAAVLGIAGVDLAPGAEVAEVLVLQLACPMMPLRTVMVPPDLDIAPSTKPPSPRRRWS